MRPLALLLPGPLDQLTGGYLYARRLVEGLRARGEAISVHSLAGRFPDADAQARTTAAAALAALPLGQAAVIDGLALAGFEDCLAAETRQRDLLALVHHPLAVETELDAATARRFHAIETRLLPLFTGVICPSARTAAAIADYGVAGARIAIVPPGTAKPPAPVRRTPRAGPLRLLSVASVTPRKGHRLAVEALAQLDRRAWQWTVIGSLVRDPACSAALRAAIAMHGLEAQVALAGEWPPDRLPEAYAAADVFLLPSYHEGYGMAFAEAMAYGLPIVATIAGAIPDTVPSSAGLLVPPDDAPALAAALVCLIADAELRAQLAAGAAAAAQHLPSWDDMVQLWLAACRQLLA